MYLANVVMMLWKTSDTYGKVYIWAKLDDTQTCNNESFDDVIEAEWKDMMYSNMSIMVRGCSET